MPAAFEQASNAGGGGGRDPLGPALDLYAATYELMVESRKERVVRRMQLAFGEMQQAVRAHAPWAIPEVNELLLALIETIRLLNAGQKALDRARGHHAAALLLLRDFLSATRAPWT